MTDRELVAALTDAFDLEARAVPADAARRVAGAGYRVRRGMPRTVAALAVAAVIVVLAACLAVMGQSPRTHGAPAGVLPSPRVPTSAPVTAGPRTPTAPASGTPSCGPSTSGGIPLPRTPASPPVSFTIPTGPQSSAAIGICPVAPPAGEPRSTGTATGKGN